MARKTLNYKVQDEGRDNGKVFVITELPASKAEAWATRALLALMASGVEVPAGFENMGMAAMAEIGIKALSKLSWEVAEPLLDEMWECVQFMPEPTRPHVLRSLFEEDIEEIMTRVKIRREIWSLHTGFSLGVANSTSKDSKAAPKKVTRSSKTSRR